MALSKVTPLDQISSNFQHGLQILKSYRQEKGTRAEKPKTRNDASDLSRRPKGFVGRTRAGAAAVTTSAGYPWGRRDRGYMLQIQR